MINWIKDNKIMLLGVALFIIIVASDAFLNKLEL